MATPLTYNNVYWSGWSSPSGTQGYLYIDEVDGTATPTEIRLKADGINLTYNFSDWNEPIIGLQVTFEIINDRSDFFELMPLLTASERQYKVRITVVSPYTQTLFDGFLNCDTVQQKYLHRQTISFTASNYLMKLDNLKVLSINTIQNIVAINAIDEILQSGGSFFNIRVNSTLHATGDTLSALDTLFNKNGFNSEVFWDDNVTRKSALEILKSILTSFDCYMYWFDGFWYIDRYEDMGKETTDYVEYTTGSLYDPITPGDSIFSITQPIEDIHSLQFTKQSQTLFMIPGYKEIEIDLDDKRMFNLLNPDLTKIAEMSYDPLPDMRQWGYTYGVSTVTFSDFGKVYSTIRNSIKRTATFPHTPSGMTPPEVGVSSHFIITVESETEMTIKFKYGCTLITDRKKWDVFFWYYIREVGTSNYIRMVNDVWSIFPQLSEREGCQYVKVTGSSFDPIPFVTEASISIPIGKATDYINGAPAGKIKGDREFIILIGSEEILKTGIEPDSTWDPSTYVMDQAEVSWWGDVEVSTTGANQPNVIVGTLNETNSLNKKTIKLELYDTDSYDYKNGLLRGETLQYRTQGWGNAGGAANCIARGVTWNTIGSPTIDDDDFTTDGSGTGSFTSQVTGLTKNTHYYLRAYATDGDGVTIYGDTVEFDTTSLEVGGFYQGGYIYYIFVDGDYRYVAGETHGIIVAPDGYRGTQVWGRLSGLTTYSPGAIQIGAGYAQENMDLINGSDQADYGYKIIMDYGTSDFPAGSWLWPTVVDLLKLRAVKNIIPGMNDPNTGLFANWYWSSTEAKYGVGNLLDFPYMPAGDVKPSSEWKFSWAVNFANTAAPDTWRKNNVMNFRAIKYF
jgi:hypothetical protein